MLTLTAQQPTAFTLSSSHVPTGQGYIIAFTSDGSGVAVGHNTLLGTVGFKTASGHYGTYNMVGFRSLSGSAGPAGTLMFDGINLEKWPNGAILPEFPSGIDNNSNRLVVESPISDMTGVGTPVTTTFSGEMFNNSSGSYPFSFNMSSCLINYQFNSTFPPTTPSVDSIVPSGNTGWLDFYSSDGPFLSLYMNYNPDENSNASAFSGATVLPGYCDTACPSFNITYFTGL